MHRPYSHAIGSSSRTTARAAYETNPDCLDALIASLLVRAHSRGLCEIIPEGHMVKAKAEGWIAIPQVGSLDRLPGI